MIDIKTLKIGDIVKHIEYGDVEVVMIQAYKNYDFIGFEHDGNYHKDTVQKFFNCNEVQDDGKI